MPEPRPTAIRPPLVPRPPAGLAPIAGWAPLYASGEQMLMPGELTFGRGVARLRTLLGSCVAVVVWHPQRRLGGMCHYLLPSRTAASAAAAATADGRYGTEAVGALVQAVRAAGLNPGGFTAHLYGGADTMAEHGSLKFNVGERNIEQGWSLIDQHGFALDGVDVGDHVPRTITLDLATGAIACRRGQAAHA